MFGKLKDKLKSALSIFSKKAEEEVGITPEEKVEEKVEVREEVKISEKKIEIKEEKKKPELVKEKVVEEKKEKVIEKKKEEKTIHEHKKEPEHKPKPEHHDKKKEEVEVVEEKEKIPPDTVKITYFVHGTTIDNEKDISSGCYDVELSELGVQQSIKLANQIKNKHFEVVFCSNLKRAIHSAELTFKDKVKIIQDKRLRECDYGEYNAKPSKIVEPLQEKNILQRFPDGESYEDVKKRIAEFLTFLRENYAGKHVAIVAHKAPQLVFDVLLKNKTWKQAFAEDWRKRKAWQPGWEYYLTDKTDLTTKPIEEPEGEEIAEPEEKRGFFSKLFGKKEEVEEKVEEEKKEEVKEEKKVKEPTKEAEPEEKKGFFDKIKQTLTTKTISADKFEELFWELEVALLENNVSVEVIERIKEDLKEELVDKPIPRDVERVIEETLQRTMRDILSFEKINLVSLIKKKSKKPYVIAFFGINGSGKTTSIAKLTHYLKKNGFSVVLAACDTFRAAAIQQLEEHADKLGVKMIKHDYGSDSAAVAFDAVKYAEKNNIDVVLVDTAGRLHSNTNLMAELEKIIRVTKPDLKLFVGESITGNDCIEQAKQFNALVEMDGAILTKADVDEKGGAPLSIAYTINKPILFLGVGQNYDDLEEFDTDVMMKRLGF